MADQSVIVPAFNEATRLPAVLRDLRAWSIQHAGGTYDVTVINDGSDDTTGELLARLAADWPQLLVLRHSTNFGKGRALRTGVAAARGDLILLADADGATPIEAELKLRQALMHGADIAIGSRRIGSERIQRSWIRRLSGAAFAWAVRLVFGLPESDTQCGFKMFRREVAQRLFAICREDGYLIDVEVLLHAHRLGYKVVEVPVAWRDVPGSKVRLLRDGRRMLAGLWGLRQRIRREWGNALPRQHSESAKNESAKPLTMSN